MSGAAAWNVWRQQWPNVQPNLDDLPIDMAACGGGGAFNFDGVHLAGTTFTGARLTGSCFRRSKLTNVTFSECNLTGVAFEQARLCTSNFFGGTISGSALFLRATLTKCRFLEVEIIDGNFHATTLDQVVFLDETVLVRCNFSEATMNACHLVAVRLCEVSLAWAKLPATTFDRVTFATVDLFAADLSGADLRGAKGYVLDNNIMRNTLLVPWAADDWSALRQTYTGTKMIFNLTLLASFFLPIVFSAVYWTMVGSAQSKLPTWVWMAAGYHPTSTAGLMFGNAREWIEAWQALLYQWKPWPLLKLVAGPLLIMYNLLRLALTYFTGPLRDEEVRSGHAPRRSMWDKRGDLPRSEMFSSLWDRLKQSYGWLVPQHRCAVVLAWVAYAVAAIKLVSVIGSHAWMAR